MILREVNLALNGGCLGRLQTLGLGRQRNGEFRGVLVLERGATYCTVLNVIGCADDSAGIVYWQPNSVLAKETDFVLSRTQLD